MEKINVTTTKRIVGRAAVELVQSFTPIKTEVYINKNNRRVSLKSILGVLSMGIEPNENIIIEFVDNQYANEIKEILEEKM